MKLLRYIAAIVIALVLGFLTGRLTNPKPVKASGLNYVVRVSAPTDTVTVAPMHGTPVSLSCSGDSCYVLTVQ
jgi:hypothetical protein